MQTKRTFWYAPQLDSPIYANDPRATVTVRIDTQNELPVTLPEMLAALREIRLKLGAKAVCESNVSDFAKIVDHNTQAEFIRNLQDKTDFIRLQEIHILASPQGKVAEAKEKVERLIESSESSIETKFAAVLEAERIDLIESHRHAAPQSTGPQIHLRSSLRLLRLTKKGPPGLKLYALIARKAAELDVLTFQDFGLYMNWLGHVREGDPAIAVQLAIERLGITHLIVKKYGQCVRLAQLASNSPHRWAVPTALVRVVHSIGFLVLRLRIEGQTEAAKGFTESAMQLCRLAVWIAERNRDDDALSAVTTAVLVLSDKITNGGEDSEFVKFARDTLSKIRDRKQAEDTRAALNRGIRRLSGEKVEGDPERDLIKQVIENRASGLGIDITNPNDLLAEFVRLGIRDANPERVLRHCEHIFVSIRGDIPLKYYLSQMLQLPSMLGKYIHCDLHDFVVAAPTLDGGFQEFKKRHCDGCKDRAPRLADWKYTDEWQEQENKRHLEFMQKFYKRRRSE